MSCNVSWERSQRQPLVPNGIPRPTQELGMRRAPRALVAAGLLAAASITAFVVAGPAVTDFAAAINSGGSATAPTT